MRTLSSTCAASSRVGVRISARIGDAAARVALGAGCGHQPLQHRQREAGRLAGAGLRAAQQVAARQDGGMACAWMGVGVS